MVERREFQTTAKFWRELHLASKLTLTHQPHTFLSTMSFRSSLCVAAAAIQINAFTVPSNVSVHRGASLRMADKQEIEVVSQPSEEFLEKKG